MTAWLLEANIYHFLTACSMHADTLTYDYLSFGCFMRTGVGSLQKRRRDTYHW